MNNDGISDRREIPVQIASADNDVYINEDGSVVTDMFGANGSVLLGHGEASSRQALIEQCSRVWNTGSVPTAVRRQAETALEGFFSNAYHCLGLYSTGMEAAEFAIRVARTHTRRSGLAGFEGAMHGKSLATAYLGWDNRDDVALPGAIRLPGIASNSESSILAALSSTLSAENISAVFIEPLQATSGGHSASREFYLEAARLCRDWGALLVFDEILTGCHRTGPRFMFEALGIKPDLVLVGKALGNGFPISAVMAQPAIRCDRRMLPGSTFAGNPLAASIAVAVIARLRAQTPDAQVQFIETTVTRALSDSPNATLRGRGALWILELASEEAARTTAQTVYRGGALVGQAGPYLRLLPPLTITRPHLEDACQLIAGALTKLSRTPAP